MEGGDNPRDAPEQLHGTAVLRLPEAAPRSSSGQESTCHNLRKSRLYPQATSPFRQRLLDSTTPTGIKGPHPLPNQIRSLTYPSPLRNTRPSPASRGALLTPGERGGVSLSLVDRERIPALPPCQEEAPPAVGADHAALGRSFLFTSPFQRKLFPQTRLTPR